MSSQRNNHADEGMSQEEMVREIFRRIVGDGTEENPGLDKRVDRLEQRGALYTWAVNTGVAAVVSIIVAWATTKFGGKP